MQPILRCISSHHILQRGKGVSGGEMRLRVKKKIDFGRNLKSIGVFEYFT